MNHKKNIEKSKPRLPAAVRQSRIQTFFERNGFVSVSNMAAELNVTTMTIRRDIAILEKKGLLERIHGGAVAIDPAPEIAFDQEEPAFDQRIRLQSKAKLAIAKAAAQLVMPNEAIGLDVGTTSLALSNELSKHKGLSIVTNNLRSAIQLAPSDNAVYVLGGKIRMPEFSIVGARTIKELSEHFLDHVFIGVSGLDASGYFDYSPEESQVKLAYAANAKSIVLICDSSKFNRQAMVRVASLESVNILVTDAEPPAEIKRALSEANVEIIIA
jgi:DeoR family glycerol-3-phosphate regulon repressor